MAPPTLERASDRDWNEAFPEKPARLPEAVLQSFKSSHYRSKYVEMRDGIRVALDILLPHGPGIDLRKEGGVPVVLHQTRYMRGVKLRRPMKGITNGKPLDFVNFELKACCVAAGYGVVSMDVRGTGASFGRWRMPWSPEERRDSVEVIDWICRQPWSNGQVVLTGVSYDGTAALFTAAQRHPAVVGCAPLYAFWDIYQDVALPGGIAQKLFVSNWSRFNRALDADDFSLMPFPNSQVMRVISKGCQPVVQYPARRRDLSKAQVKAAKREGAALLRQAVAGHDSWDAAGELEHVRYVDDVGPTAGVHIPEVSTCSVASALAQSGVPLMIVAGWLDVTASAAIHAFCHAAKAPGSELIIGPWAHGGLLDCQVAHAGEPQPTRFYRSLRILSFFDRCCGGYNPPFRCPDFTTEGNAPGGLGDTSLGALEYGSPTQAATAAVGVGATASAAAGAHVMSSAVCGNRPTQEEQTQGLLFERAASVISQGLGEEFFMAPDEGGQGVNGAARGAAQGGEGGGGAGDEEEAEDAGVHDDSDEEDEPATNPLATPEYRASMELLSRLSVTDPAKPYASASLGSEVSASTQSANSGDSSDNDSMGDDGDVGDNPASPVHTDASHAGEAHISPFASSRQQSVRFESGGSPETSRPANGVKRAGSGFVAPSRQSSIPQPVGRMKPGRGAAEGVAEGYATATGGPRLQTIESASDRERSAAEQPASTASATTQGGQAAAAGMAPSIDTTTPPTHNEDEYDINQFDSTDPGLLPVHYFMMGHGGGWRAAPAWPPPERQAKPYTLFLGPSTGKAEGGQSGSTLTLPLLPIPVPLLGSLKAGTKGAGGLWPEPPPGPAQRWQHKVSRKNWPKGMSRYEVITNTTKPIRYTKLRSCGHALFTSAPLDTPLPFAGWPRVALWVESSGQDADVFVYLEDFDPQSGKARYVTEGMLRASNRKAYPEPPPQNPRAAAWLPEETFRSYLAADAQPLQAGQAALCVFELQPTAYCYPPGHCVRIGVAGADAKHFSIDHTGSRTLWLHSGPGTPSALHLPMVQPSEA